MWRDSHALHRIFLVPALVAACGFTSFTFAAEHENDHISKGGANAAALADVPKEVRTVLEKEAQGREIRDVKKETEAGQVMYAAKIAREGKDLKLKIAEDGRVISRSDSENADKDATTASGERSVRKSPEHDGDDVKNLSAPEGHKAHHHEHANKEHDDHDADDVSDQADRHVDEAKAKADRDVEKSKADASAHKEKAEADANYEKRLDKDAKNKKAKDNDEHLGKSDQDDRAENALESGAVTLASVPASVREALRKEAHDSDIGTIDRETDHGRVVYKAKIRENDGNDRKVFVSEDGKVLSKKD